MLLSSSQQGGKHLVALPQNPCETIQPLDKEWQMWTLMQDEGERWDVNEHDKRSDSKQRKYSVGVFFWTALIYNRFERLHQIMYFEKLPEVKLSGVRCLYNFVYGRNLSSFDENILKSCILNQLCKIQPDFLSNNLKITWKQLESIPAPEVGWNLFSASVRKLLLSLAWLPFYPACNSALK